MGCNKTEKPQQLPITIDPSTARHQQQPAHYYTRQAKCKERSNLESIFAKTPSFCVLPPAVLPDRGVVTRIIRLITHSFYYCTAPAANICRAWLNIQWCYIRCWFLFCLGLSALLASEMLCKCLSLRAKSIFIYQRSGWVKPEGGGVELLYLPSSQYTHIHTSSSGSQRQVALLHV